jgi:hypothetical protein
MRVPAVALAALATLALATAAAPAQNGEPPKSRELRALFERVVANQHRNDEAIAVSERVERHVSLKARPEPGRTPEVKEDKTYRVFPTGTGTIKLLLREGSRDVDAAAYRTQLAGLARELERAMNPASDVQRPKVRKFDRRRAERREQVDATLNAFTARWLGREELNGRMAAKIELSPNPDFQPKSRNASFFRHVRAVVWVDERDEQLARVEAEIIRDISVGGGVLGKLYRGGTFRMEQRPAEGGVWVPVRYQFDFEGRKFLLSFAAHERIELADWRRVGPPAEALALVRRELDGAVRSAAAPE